MGVGRHAEHAIGCEVRGERRPPREADEWWVVPGGAEQPLGERGGRDAVDDGRERAGLEVADLAVQAPQHLCGVLVLQGVGAQRAAKAAHHDRRLQAVTDDIAHDQAEATIGQLEHVVPVSAEVAGGRDVAGRDRDAFRSGQDGR